MVTAKCLHSCTTRYILSTLYVPIAYPDNIPWRQTALEGQDVSCMYLAHHELESVIIIVIAVMIIITIVSILYFYCCILVQVATVLEQELAPQVSLDAGSTMAQAHHQAPHLRAGVSQ